MIPWVVIFLITCFIVMASYATLQKSYRLKKLIREFNLKGENSHRAMDDVMATKELVDYCYNKIKERFPDGNIPV